MLGRFYLRVKPWGIFVIKSEAALQRQARRNEKYSGA